MRTALINGKIFCENQTFCQALLVEDHTILKTGSNAEILNEKNDTILDLKGKVVLPAFNDSHMHISMLGEILCDIDLSSCRSIKEIQQTILSFYNAHPNVSLLHGIGWNQDMLLEKRMLEKKDLDQILPHIPMVMERVCTHILTVNQAMIDQTLLPDSFDRRSGIAKENECVPFLKKVHRKSKETVRHHLECVATHCLSKGITSLQTADMKEDNFEMLFEVYEEFSKQKKIRLCHQFNIEDPQKIDQLLKMKPENPEFHQIGPIKLFMDGSLGARTALLKKPYADDPVTNGIQVICDQKFEEILQYAKDHHLQVITHAIGDQAIQKVLDHYKKFQDTGNPLRWGIVHVQITDKALIDQFRNQNILALIQPIFLEYDLHIVEDRVGKDLASTSYAFYSLPNISLGTDAPVEQIDPMNNLHCALFRQDYAYWPKDGWNIQEALSLKEALTAYTQGSAFVQFKEERLGKIAPGYLADLVVLDQDIFLNPTLLLNTQVLATMCNGKWVYKKENGL